MGFQASPGFQFGFQQAMASLEEEGHQVVLFPGTLTFRRKRDAALYVLAMIARERAPQHAKFAMEEEFDWV